jgi:hypothetical protein
MREAHKQIESRQDLQFAWLECAVLNILRDKDHLTPHKLLTDRPYG